MQMQQHVQHVAAACGSSMWQLQVQQNLCRCTHQYGNQVVLVTCTWKDLIRDFGAFRALHNSLCTQSANNKAQAATG